MKCIDSEKLIAEIERQKKIIEINGIKYKEVPAKTNDKICKDCDYFLDNGSCKLDDCPCTCADNILERVQQEQPAMIQWTGNNLKEVIDFTGKSPRFEEWFKSWEEFETYVHQHNDILKLFSEDGSHYEVPVGAWIVKTPDGYNVPSVAKYIRQKSEVDLDALVNEAFDKYGGYGQLVVSFNRAELYSFIKKIARKEK